MTQVLHYLSHFFLCADAAELHGDHCFAVETVAAVQLLKRLIEVHAHGFVAAGHFCDEHAGHHRVLVPGVGAGEVAVAFLKTEQEGVVTGAFEFLDFFADELEAGQRFKQGDAVFLTYFLRHVGGDNALHSGRVFRQCSGFTAGGDQVVQEKDADLVAGESLIGVAVSHHDAAPVSVRVGTDDQIHIFLFRHTDGEVEALYILWIGGFDRGKVSVDDHLFRNGQDMFHAEPLQNLRYDFVARAVEGRVDDPECVLYLIHIAASHGLLQNFRHIFLVHFRAEQSNHSRCVRVFSGHCAYIPENIIFVHGSGNLCGVLRGQLRAVRPIDFVAVVLLCIVAGCDVDSCDGTGFTERKGELGRRPETLEEVDVNAVGSQNAGGLRGKFRTVVAGVEGDGDAASNLFTAAVDQVCEPLCRIADRICIHAVQSGPHDAPQSGRSEIQHTGEPVRQFLRVAAQRLQLVLCGRIDTVAGQPLFIFLHVIHNSDSFLVLRENHDFSREDGYLFFLLAFAGQQIHPYTVQKQRRFPLTAVGAGDKT